MIVYTVYIYDKSKENKKMKRTKGLCIKTELPQIKKQFKDSKPVIFSMTGLFHRHLVLILNSKFHIFYSFIIGNIL